jgi:PAS domain S-box-containing protein
MAARMDKNMDNTVPTEGHAPAEPVPRASETVESERAELWEVNEHLLIAGLREHELADQLRRQLAFSRAITESLAEGVYAVDQAGRITFANPAAEHMLGWMEADLLGRDAHAVVLGQRADDRQAPGPDSQRLEMLRAGAVDRNEDAVFTRQDETRFPVAYSAAPIVTDGQVVGAVVTFRDLTEMQRLQRTREDYLALLSHDLRTPLATISGSAQVLQQRLVQRGLEREVTLVRAVVENSARMNSMIQELLDHSRLEAGSAALHLATVDLAALVTRMVDQIGTPADQQRIRVEAGAPLPVEADAVRIERVVANVLTNALKYSAPDSPVVARVSSDGKHAVVAIADQGIGIDPDDLPHLFEKYFRARTAGPVDGIGLGLYSSWLIVDAHGGNIWAESAVGTGSTFRFSLPLSRPRAGRP